MASSISNQFVTLPVGTVTQITNPTTGVTLNAKAGIITMQAAVAKGAGAQTFKLTNSYIKANSVVVVNSNAYGATTNAFPCWADTIADGSCNINHFNSDVEASTNVPVISFSVYP